MPSTVVVRCADGFTHTIAPAAASGRRGVPPTSAIVLHDTGQGTVVTQHEALVVPERWLRGPLRGYHSDRRNLHLCSESFVFRWQRTGAGDGGRALAARGDLTDDLFLKAQSLDNVRDPPVSREADVLRYLHETHPDLAASGVPVPRVVSELTEAGAGYLLTEGLRGRSYGDLSKTAREDFLASTPALSQDAATDAIASCVRANALALRQLHDEISIEGCPFQCGIASEIAAARARLQAGALGNLRVAASEHTTTAEEELAQLEALTPTIEAENGGLDLVFTHGDWCLPNVLLASGHSGGDGTSRPAGGAQDYNVSGVVDWGYAGVADRWRDLVKAQWSVGYNYGKEWVPRWLEWYGITRDERKAKFFEDIANFL